jgi:hypothetical protein
MTLLLTGTSASSVQHRVIEKRDDEDVIATARRACDELGRMSFMGFAKHQVYVIYWDEFTPSVEGFPTNRAQPIEIRSPRRVPVADSAALVRCFGLDESAISLMRVSGFLDGH